MIQIFVEDQSYFSLAYGVSLDSPIRSLKDAIEEEEGKPAAQQSLKYQGQELEDSRAFTSYNISNGSVVRLREKPLNRQVFVKTLKGDTITCEPDFNALILFLKIILLDKERIPVDQQRLVWKGKELEQGRTLISYGVQKEDTIQLVLRLRGGGSVRSDVLAYAVACRPWDGNMNHHKTKGLKLSHRGMVVVITGKRSEDWYCAREPDLGPESEGVVPCHLVHIVKDFRQLDLNLSPEPWSFFPPTASKRNVSETKEIEALGLNNPPEDLPIVPEGPLPPFLFPWAEPRIFSRAFANSGHSVLEICITYNPEAVPGEPNILNVTLKCLAFGDRVSEVSIQVTVPNGEVLDVQSPPPTMIPGLEGEMQVKISTRNEQKSGFNAGIGGTPALNASHGNTSVTGEERTGTVPNTQMSISGHSLHRNTALWLIKEGATVKGGAGLPAELSDMSFTINKQPESFRFDCLVKVGTGKQYSLKSSGGSSLWYKLLYGSEL